MCDSIIEGTRESLERMGLDYVDVLFAHRYDNTGVSCDGSSVIDPMNLMHFVPSSHGGGGSRIQLDH